MIFNPQAGYALCTDQCSSFPLAQLAPLRSPVNVQSSGLITPQPSQCCYGWLASFMTLNCFYLSFLLRDEQLGKWWWMLQNLSARQKPLHEGERKIAPCTLVDIFLKWISTVPVCLCTMSVFQEFRTKCQPEKHTNKSYEDIWDVAFHTLKRIGIPVKILAARSISRLFISSSFRHCMSETWKKCMKFVQPQENLASIWIGKIQHRCSWSLLPQWEVSSAKSHCLPILCSSLQAVILMLLSHF